MAGMSHRHSQQLKDRAVRLVVESRQDYDSEWNRDRVGGQEAGDRLERRRVARGNEYAVYLLGYDVGRIAGLAAATHSEAPINDNLQRRDDWLRLAGASHGNPVGATGTPWLRIRADDKLTGATADGCLIRSE
jgi:hypothetical protein